MRTLVIALALFASPAAAQQTDRIISGYGYAIAANSIRIGDDTVRLAGVSTPALEQTGMDRIGRSYPAGLFARDVLAALIAEQPLGCRVVPEGGKEKDDAGRYRAICAAHQTADLGLEMIRRGWAFADRSGHGPVYADYAAAEDTASKILRGIWQGPIDKPWERDREEKTR